MLPRFDNTIYIIIEEGDHFGVIDLVPDDKKKKNKSKRRKTMKKEAWEVKRKFTVQSIMKSSIMALKVEDLSKINSEFPDIYEELFFSAFRRQKIALTVKNQVISNIIGSA